MAYAKGMHPGAVWHKADLQCHSPRDRGWQGTASLPGGGQAEEQARRSWAAEFIAVCKDRGLSIASITDHHDICLADYVRVAANGDDDFVFYPGIEVTCRDNAQCLIIFDPSCGVDFQNKVLGLLTNAMPAGREEEKTCITQPIGRTVTELYQAILDDEHLREHCILFPHFGNQDNSHKSLNEVGHHHRFAALGCDGVYVEVPIAQLDEPTKQKIRGEIPDWGSRRRALIPTGDNRREDWARLGAHDCWIKLGEPTIEGIRQALLADEARIAFDAPKEPDERLVTLTVQSTLFGNDPVSVRFNPGFNAIIGGRGSGKSALLEYLRFGLGRTATDMPSGESRLKDRAAKLIEETLKDGGYVAITLEREGISETWRRDYANRETISVRDAAGSVTTVPLSDAQRRFPGRAFDQKGLSSTMTDPKRAADQITGIAAAEEVEQRRRIDEDIQSAKRSVTLALQQLAAYWQARLDAQRKAAFATETQTRASLVAERLRAEGVSAEAREIIAKAPSFAQGAAYIRDLEAGISSAVAELTALSPRLLSESEQAPKDTDLSIIAQLKNDAGKAAIVIQQRIQDAIGVLEELDRLKNVAKVAFGHEELAFREIYAEARIEQQAHRAIIDENAKLSEALQAARHEEQAATKAAEEASHAVEALATATERLKEHLGRRRQVLKDAAAKVADHSSQTLKARMKGDPLPTEYVDATVALLEGSRVSDSRERVAEWIKAALKSDPGAWASISGQILQLYESKSMAGAPAEPGDALLARIKGLFLGGGQLTSFAATRVYSLLSDATVGAVLSAVPRDHIILTYVDSNGKDLAFEKASEGQQASALLELLLRQSAGTLIIDQPEDDLDNNVVMKIVELIRASKSNRQLVFATHNPNIVVNGDADKVITLEGGRIDPRPDAESPRVGLKTDGAIETPSVKRAITDIMEGGELAFDLRRRKYRFGVKVA
ncbi:TrlF family AAA-like ATPase [Xanthobacter versatilis]|uniref:TrlF family AAA-like ATPase n=1 Tax=Xanthobacter autotrophicus (strain ATCC BAA-1158 / Py2) TaxID=78245 RepID=UPI00372B9B86